MERVGVLINKLQQQLNEQANVQHMLATAQLLQNELLMQCKQANGSESKKVAVMMPYNITAPLPIIVADEPEKTDATVEEPQQVPKLIAEPEAVAEVSEIEAITAAEPIVHVDEAVTTAHTATEGGPCAAVPLGYAGCRHIACCVEVPTHVDVAATDGYCMD